MSRKVYRSNGVYASNDALTEHPLSEQFASFNNEINDILVLSLDVDSNRSVTTPSGWTVDISFLGAANAVSHYVLTKRATAANEAPPDIVLSAADGIVVHALAVRGCPTSGAYIGNTSTNSGTSDTPNWSSISHSAYSAVLFNGAMDIDTLQTVGDKLVLNANDPGQVSGIMAYDTYTAAGTTGSIDGTAALPDNWVTSVIEFLDDGSENTGLSFNQVPFGAMTAYAQSDTDNSWRDVVADSGEDWFDGTAFADLSFDASAVDTGTDEIPITAHGLTNGDVIRANANGNTLPTGIVDGNYYFASVVDADTITLRDANDPMAANGDWYPNVSTVNITAVGSGTCQFRVVKIMVVSMSAAGDFTRPSSNSSAGFQWQSSGIEFTTPRDMSSEVFSTRIDTTTVSGSESIMCFIDSDGDYKTWQMSDGSTFNNDGFIQVDLANDLFTTEFGTFDSTSVKYVVLALRRNVLSNRGIGLKFYTNEVNFVKSIQPIGTSSSLWDDIYEELQLYTSETSSTELGFQYTFLQNIIIGAGHLVSDPDCDFTDSAYSVGFPAAADGVNTFANYLTALGVTIDVNAASTVSLTNGQIGAEGLYDFAISPNRPAGATIVLSNNSFIKPNATFQSDDVVESATLIEHTRPTFNDCTLTNCAFINGTNPDGFILFTEALSDKATNLSFQTDTPSDYAIKIEDPGSYNMENFPFLGFTTPLNITAVMGPVEITLALGQTEPAYDWPAGTVDFILPTADLTVTSSESGSLIQVFATGTQTILASTTGASLVYTHSSETVDVVVQKAGFILFRQTGRQLDGTVDITANLVADLNYISGHGLTYTTDASWSRANNELTVPTFGPTGQEVYSLMVDAFIAEASLRNTAFNLQMNGPQSLIFINGAEGASDTDIQNLTQCGVEYRTAAGVDTAEWIGIDSSGVQPTSQVRFEQESGGTISTTRSTGNADQLVKTYGDATHGNFDYRDYFDAKVQTNGFRQAEIDFLSAFGVSQLSPILYIFSLTEIPIEGLTLGDPAPTGLTLTDDSAAPVSWDPGLGAKDFSITITDTGDNSGETILRWLNYNLAQTGNFEGLKTFDWPEMVIQAGGSYETLQGILHKTGGDLLAGTRVIDGSGNPHPDFARFQSDDGTYTGPVVVTTTQILVPAIVDGSKYLVFLNGTPTSGLQTVAGGNGLDIIYTLGVDYAVGDTWEIWIVYYGGLTAKGELSISGTFGATTSVVERNDEQPDCPVYAANSIDGADEAPNFTADTANDEIDITVTESWSILALYAWYKYEMTQSEASLLDLFKQITAINQADYQINDLRGILIRLGHPTGTRAKETSGARLRTVTGDGDPVTLNNNVDVNYRTEVFVTDLITELEEVKLLAREAADLSAP